MKSNTRSLLLPFLELSLLHLSVVSADPCSQGCSCIQNPVMDCTNPTFPIIIPSVSINYINIVGNLSTIPANALRQATEHKLTTLSINLKEISNIESYAFNNLVIQKVLLHKSRIKHLEARVFANLTSDILSIYNCEIDTMPSFLFEGLTSGLLSVHKNNITTLETNVFKSANVDKKVSFFKNKIDAVQKNAFSNDNLTIEFYKNAIKKFYVQDSVVPSYFHFNTIMCICSLAWMWKKDSAFNRFLASNKCLKRNQYADIILKKVNQTLLCMNENSSQTSEWEIYTTNSNTEQFESSQPNSKETPGTESTTRFATTKKSEPKSASLKPSVNLVLIIIESVIVGLFMLFQTSQIKMSV